MKGGIMKGKKEAQSEIWLQFTLIFEKLQKFMVSDEELLESIHGSM